MSRPGLILSSYAAAPALDGWDPPAESAFLSSAAALPGVAGLEIPFYATGGMHKYDGGWFLRQVRHLPDDLSYVLTTIPDTMDQLSRSADFGLASTVAAGRGAALARAAAAASAVRTLNTVLGRKAVRAVHLFSAPRLVVKNGGPTPASAPRIRALAESLKQLSDIDWDGAQPVIEHCDAATGKHSPVKGFLRFEQEMEAVLSVSTAVGVAVNWGRSLIEDRDAGAPARQVEAALKEGVLAGVVLSGCSPRPTVFGGAWDDCHLPPAPLEPDSLLTTHRISSIASALDGGLAGTEPSVYRGLKVSAPHGSRLEQRLSILTESIKVSRAAGF